MDALPPSAGNSAHLQVLDRFVIHLSIQVSFIQVGAVSLSLVWFICKFTSSVRQSDR